MARRGSYVRIDGADEVLRRLDGINDAVLAELEKAVLDGAEMVAQDAREKSKGRIKDAIRVRTIRKNKGGITVTVGPEGTDEVGSYVVEYGHALVRGKKVVSHVPAHPFLRPALDENRSKVRRRIRGKFKAVIEEVTGGD